MVWALLFISQGFFLVLLQVVEMQFSYTSFLKPLIETFAIVPKAPTTGITSTFHIAYVVAISRLR